MLGVGNVGHAGVQQTTIIAGGIVDGIVGSTRWAGGYQALDSAHTEPAMGAIYGDSVGVYRSRVSRIIHNWYSDTANTTFWMSLMGWHYQNEFNAVEFICDGELFTFATADASYYALSGLETIWVWNGENQPTANIMKAGDPYVVSFI